jgi:ribosomal protein S27AE
MPQKQKINLGKVMASLETICPKCGHSIAPAELRRVDFERVVCPQCGERFIPGRGR